MRCLGKMDQTVNAQADMSLWFDLDLDYPYRTNSDQSQTVQNSGVVKFRHGANYFGKQCIELPLLAKNVH